MKLDTQKPGLYALMRPYKAALLKRLYELTSTSSHEGRGSGFLWEWLNRNAEKIGIKKMSRASVINGLNDMVDRGFLKFKEVTGKGGYRRIYSVAMNPLEFERFVRKTISEKLFSIFEADWWKLEAEG